MSQHTGKLLIRFIKEWVSIIREPKVVPGLPKNNEQRSIVWNDATRKEKEKTRWRLRNITN